MKKLLSAILISALLTGCSLLELNPLANDDNSQVDSQEFVAITDGATVTGSKVKYSLFYDDTKWVQKAPEAGGPAEYSFAHVDGDVWAMVIAERLSISLDSLKKIALDNAKSLDPDAKITLEEMRKVNGLDMLAMQIEGTTEGIAFIYYGYYYTGKSTSIQAVTFTNSELFPEYKEDLTQFLNGLTIDPSTVASESNSKPAEETELIAGTLEGAMVPYVVNYDSNKWYVEEGGVNDAYEYFLSHADGDVYAMIIPERITVTRESLKQIALDNAKAVAPDAKITSETSKTVNGKDLMVLKIVGTIEGIQFQYYGYYYTGKGATIQFLTYTSPDLFSEYEEDLTALLDGLKVND